MCFENFQERIGRCVFLFLQFAHPPEQLNLIKGRVVGQPYDSFLWRTAVILLVLIQCLSSIAFAQGAPEATPIAPLTAAGKPVDWWFVFKFNAKAFPGCTAGAKPSCEFNGTASTKTIGLQYVVASSQDRSLNKGDGCLGNSDSDPVGATYASIYNGHYYYVVWNDQFYEDPSIVGCSDACAGPWGHSKGIVAWDDSGNGLVLQVSTPSWPGAGSKDFARQSDNTLGCFAQPNNVLVSQSFFSVRLNLDGVLQVLKGLASASVATDKANPQLVRKGGPAVLQSAVEALGKKSKTQDILRVELTPDVGLLVKPSLLSVPPWQFVSAELGQVPLRVASWWTNPEAIGTTTMTTSIDCWSDSLPKPGPVEIATSGNWNGIPLGLKGTASPGGNHAKVGVSKDKDRPFVIFGDMNQEGPLKGSKCNTHQNGRGGLFFIIKDPTLWKSVSGLLNGESAPLAQ
jgi:hypothetical protein